jgi:hypothetical protein
MQDRTDPTVRWHDLAAVLATIPRGAELLLDAHVASPAGRCTACTQGGTGLPGALWPCTLHSLATEALRIRGVGGRRSG